MDVEASAIYLPHGSCWQLSPRMYRPWQLQDRVSVLKGDLCAWGIVTVENGHKFFSLYPLFSAGERLVSDIPAGDRKIANLVYNVCSAHPPPPTDGHSGQLAYTFMQGCGSGSGFNLASGSGSGFVFGIRIRIQEGKNYQQK
jgi:hypothetical protein